MMMNARMKQVILYVKDMSKAVFFYRDVLGLEIKYPSGLTDYSEAMWVELDAGTCSIALHGGAKEPPGDEHQLVFTVDDLESARQSIISAGVTMGEIRILEDGKPVSSGVDPDGHRFSIR
jgi:predicted enzyme related to lactoylglutathione lyase